MAQPKTKEIWAQVDGAGAEVDVVEVVDDAEVEDDWMPCVGDTSSCSRNDMLRF